MPQKMKVQVDGKEVEQDFFTADEVAAQAEERAKKISDEQIAAERVRFEEEKNTAVAEKEQEFAAEKEELDKLRKKDFNFRQLEKKGELTEDQKAEADKVASELKKANERIDAIEKQPLETAKTSFIDSNFAADDKDQRELFDYFYKKLSVGAKTMEDVNKALIAAHNATTGGQRQPNPTGAMSRTAVSDNFGGDGGSRESEASREFGAAFGVTAEDKKKFGNVVKTNSIGLFSKNAPKTRE